MQSIQIENLQKIKLQLERLQITRDKWKELNLIELKSNYGFFPLIKNIRLSINNVSPQEVLEDNTPSEKKRSQINKLRVQSPLSENTNILKFDLIKSPSRRVNKQVKFIQNKRTEELPINNAEQLQLEREAKKFKDSVSRNKRIKERIIQASTQFHQRTGLIKKDHHQIGQFFSETKQNSPIIHSILEEINPFMNLRSPSEKKECKENKKSFSKVHMNRLFSSERHKRHLSKINQSDGDIKEIAFQNISFKKVQMNQSVELNVERVLKRRNKSMQERSNLSPSQMQIYSVLKDCEAARKKLRSLNKSLRRKQRNSLQYFEMLENEIITLNKRVYLDKKKLM